MRNELVYIQKDLMSFAMKLTKNVHDAEDLVQDTIVHLLSNSASYEETGSLKSYAMVAMRRIFINRVKRVANYKLKLDIKANLSVDYCVDSSVDRVYLEQLYNRTNDKELLTLKAQRYTFKEISKMYKKNISLIERRYKKIIKEIEHDTCLR